MKRYQNPDVYERLALEYSLGTMHGRARKRFERLMQQHPFLQVVVEEYDHKFAELATYLPEEKPSAKVWKNIEAQLDAEEVRQENSTTQSSEKKHWWQLFTTKSIATATASFVLLVSLIFVNVTQNPTTLDLACKLAGANAEVMFNVWVSKTDMEIKVLPIGEIKVPEGKEMYFWCLPKDTNKPITAMGLLSASGMKMSLTSEGWKGIESARMFGISFEQKGSNVTQPTGDFIYKGSIEALRQT